MESSFEKISFICLISIFLCFAVFLTNILFEGLCSNSRTKEDKYKVTMNSNDGQVLKEYFASSYFKNGEVVNLQVDDKTITINGTYIIEEIGGF